MPPRSRNSSLQSARTSDGRAVQLSLPGTCRADKAAKPPRRSEKVLQAQTLQALAMRGFAAFETGMTRGPVTCPCGCRHTWTPSGGKAINTIGMPDLVVYRQNGFPPVGILIEMKGDGTAVDDAQQALASAGRTQICRSIDDAVAAVLAAEIAMDAYRLSPERRANLERFLALNAHRPG